VPAKKKHKLSGPVSTATPASSWPGHAIRIAVVWLAAFLVYSNSFDSGLIFDNAAIIGQDPRIRAATPESIHLIFAKEYWYPSTTSGLYRPLTTLSYLFNYAIIGNGREPAGYHLMNLALHALNILLVYALGIMILENTVAAFAMAALWTVHPLLVESVTNIVGRADLLAGFGVLSGLGCHLRARMAAGRKRLLWLAALVAAQTIGLFSKESAAILPGLMALYDFTWRRMEKWRERALPYLLLLAPFGAFFYARAHIGTHLEVRFTENALVGASFFTARMTAIKVIGKFLWLFLWPDRLSADYSFKAIPLVTGLTNWEDSKALIALICCAALIALAIRFRERKPLFFFLGFFFIALAPTANLLFLVGTIMAERFMYLPAVALCGCVVIGAREIGRVVPFANRPWVKWISLSAISLALGMRTYARNVDWRDSESLWASAAVAYPDCARAHYGLGVALTEKSDFADAIAEFEAALRVRPDYPNALISLANALSRDPARLAEAIERYQAALGLEPDNAEAHYNLGNALARLPDRVQDAIAQWQTAIRLKPDMAEAHYNLATAYAQIPGRLSDAIAEYQAAIRIRPDYTDAHNNLAGVYSQLPDHLADSVAEYQAALRSQPDSAQIHTNLGGVLARIPGRLPDAIAQFQEAIRLEPGSGETHYRLGMALLRIPGREQDGIAELEAAYRVNPDPQGRRMIDEIRARLHLR